MAAEANLGRVRVTEDEIKKIKDEVSSALGGLKFGYTEDGKPGYVVTDEAGADTVVPFSSGGGGKLSFATFELAYGMMIYSGHYSYLQINASEYKKISYSGGAVHAAVTNATYTRIGYFKIFGYKDDGTQVLLFSKSTGSTKATNGITVNLDATEIDITDYAEIRFESSANGGYAVGYTSLNNLTFE